MEVQAGANVTFFFSGLVYRSGSVIIIDLSGLFAKINQFHHLNRL